MRRFRQGRILLALIAVACGKQTFDLLPTDAVPIEPTAEGGENSGGRDATPSAGGDGAGQPSETTGGGGDPGGGGEGGNPKLPPVGSDGGVPEQPGVGGTPDWGPIAGGPSGGHCERPISECSAATPVCMRCNPEQPVRDYDCTNPLVPLCHPGKRHCVQCIPPSETEPGSNNCPLGQLCDLLTATCRPVCGGPNPPCPEQLPICNLFDPNFGICSECTVDEHCRGPTENMQCSMGGTCVECTANYYCKDPAAPVCANYHCRPCESDCECGQQQQCDRATGRCIPP